MKYNFTKMQGAGNDYIYIDVRNCKFENISERAIMLSDRHFGIGGDGLVLLCNSTVADVRMRMFNADGSEGAICGNALRCIAVLMFEQTGKKSIDIETSVGIKQAKILCDDKQNYLVEINMGNADFNAKHIPVEGMGREVVDCDYGGYKINCVSMGNPHCVIFTKNIDELNLPIEGGCLENCRVFPDRANIEFVEFKNEKFFARVWERGSGETLACGSGACAIGAVAVKKGLCKNNEDILISLKGGELFINVREDGIYLKGGAKTVFEGVVEL